MSGREGERASEENNGDADEPRMRWVRSLSLQRHKSKIRPSVVPLSAAAPIAADSHAFYGLGRRIAVCRIFFPSSPRRTKYVVDQEKLPVPALHATLPVTYLGQPGAHLFTRGITVESITLSVLIKGPTKRSRFQRFRVRRAKEEEDERERRGSSSRGREETKEERRGTREGWRKRAARCRRRFSKLGHSIAPPRESERASERARSERSSLPAPREERESAAAATATSSSPPPPLLSPPVPSARRSPPKKQVSLFHFLAAGEGGRTNEERTNEPPMIVLHDATPTNVRTPTTALCGAAGGRASQDKLAKRGKTYLRQFSIHPFSPPLYRHKLSLC